MSTQLTVVQGQDADIDMPSLLTSLLTSPTVLITFFIQFTLGMWAGLIIGQSRQIPAGFTRHLHRGSSLKRVALRESPRPSSRFQPPMVESVSHHSSPHRPRGLDDRAAHHPRLHHRLRDKPAKITSTNRPDSASSSYSFV
jgi:hypothetical protein